MRVRIILPPPPSLDCRETPQPLIPKYGKGAHFSRYVLDNMDWRERTARQRSGLCPGFSLEGTCAVRFQGGPEGNAIRSEARDSATNGLTFVSTFGTAFGASANGATQIRRRYLDPVRTLVSASGASGLPRSHSVQSLDRPVGLKEDPFQEVLGTSARGTVFEFSFPRTVWRSLARKQARITFPGDSSGPKVALQASRPLNL